MANTVSATIFLALHREVGISTTYINRVLISFLIYALGNKCQWYISSMTQKNRWTEFPIGNLKASLPYDTVCMTFDRQYFHINISTLIFSSFRKVADPRTFHWYCLHKLLHLESQSKSN